MLLKAQKAGPAGTFSLGASITVATLAGRTEVLSALLARIPSNCHRAIAASDFSRRPPIELKRFASVKPLGAPQVGVGQNGDYALAFTHCVSVVITSAVPWRFPIRASDPGDSRSHAEEGVSGRHTMTRPWEHRRPSLLAIRSHTRVGDAGARPVDEKHCAAT
jgi:hypothetical protein